jgi:hypothetical protein
MRDQQLPNQMSHKEETAGRMKTDQKDREILRSKLQLAIDPLDPQQHSEGLVNVISGSVLTDPKINVDDATHIGAEQLKEFETGWPESFHRTLSKKLQ